MHELQHSSAVYLFERMDIILNAKIILEGAVFLQPVDER